MGVAEIALRWRERAVEDAKKTELEEMWHALMDNAADSPADALADPRCPQYGDPHPDYPTHVLTHREGRRVAKTRPPRIDIVTRYTASPTDAQKLEAKSIDPLSRDMEVTRDTREITIPLLIDRISDAIICNTVGDPIAGLTTTREVVVYTVTINVDSNPAQVDQLAGKMNAAAVSIWGDNWPTHTVRLIRGPVSLKRSELGQQYRRCTYTLVCDPSTHNLKVLNAGLYEMINGEKVPCEINGERVTTPVPLDSAGRMIPAAVLQANPVTAPHYLDVHQFEEADFNGIQLPSSIV